MSDPLNLALQTITQSLPSIDDQSYQAWIDTASETLKAERGLVDERLARIGAGPKLDILIAASGDPWVLRMTLDSLRSQIYKHFQVLIGYCSDRAVGMDRLIANFPDLSIRLIATEGPPSDIHRFEDAALKASDADFVAFLAPGDRLAYEAVAEIVLAIDRRPDIHVIFTDEDWIDENGRRSNPRFKTAWDPEAHYGLDQLGRFSPTRRSLALKVGGLRGDAGLACHFDFHCRITELAGPAGILHLPAVLSHSFRQAKNSSVHAEDYARASRRVAQDAIWRKEGVRAKVGPAPNAPWLNRVEWPLPESEPSVSILMPTRDRAELVEVAARGVLHQTNYSNLELIIMDNGSSEPETLRLFETLSRDPRVRILPMPGEFNYSKLNNDAAAVAKGEILVLLNNDVEISHSSWLREMVSVVVREEIGCVGAKLLYRDERIQHAGVSMDPHMGCAHVGRLLPGDHPGNVGSLAIASTHSAVTAACLAIRSRVFAEVGGLDEVSLKIGYNDVDLCLRVGDWGYRCVINPNAVLFHLESVSRGPNDNPLKQKRERFEQGLVVSRWRDVFLDDPFRNPNTELSWDKPLRLRERRRPREWAAQSSTGAMHS